MGLADLLRDAGKDIGQFEVLLMREQALPADAAALEQMYRAYYQHSPAVSQYSMHSSRAPGTSSKDPWFRISTAALREIVLRSIPEEEREFFRTLMTDRRTSRDRLFAGYYRDHTERQCRAYFTKMYLDHITLRRACAELPQPVKEKFDKAVTALCSYFRRYQEFLDAPYPSRLLLPQNRKS